MLKNNTQYMARAQPGVASVYCAVVQQTHDGSEFYIKDFPELAGTCYADARRRFNSATLCAQDQSAIKN